MHPKSNSASLCGRQCAQLKWHQASQHTAWTLLEDAKHRVQLHFKVQKDHPWEISSQFGGCTYCKPTYGTRLAEQDEELRHVSHGHGCFAWRIRQRTAITKC